MIVNQTNDYINIGSLSFKSGVTIGTNVGTSIELNNNFDLVTKACDVNIPNDRTKNKFGMIFSQKVSELFIVNPLELACWGAMTGFAIPNHIIGKNEYPACTVYLKDQCQRYDNIKYCSCLTPKTASDAETCYNSCRKADSDVYSVPDDSIKQCTTNICRIYLTLKYPLVILYSIILREYVIKEEAEVVVKAVIMQE